MGGPSSATHLGGAQQTPSRLSLEDTLRQLKQYAPEQWAALKYLAECALERALR
jgi:hypothetical protein